MNVDIVAGVYTWNDEIDKRVLLSKFIKALFGVGVVGPARGSFDHDVMGDGVHRTRGHFVERHEVASTWCIVSPT